MINYSFNKHQFSNYSVLFIPSALTLSYTHLQALRTCPALLEFLLMQQETNNKLINNYNTRLCVLSCVLSTVQSIMCINSFGVPQHKITALSSRNKRELILLSNLS